MNSLSDQPAFPQPMSSLPTGEMYTACEKHPSFGGMTILQHYAGLAMQGLLADPTNNGAVSDHQMRKILGENWMAKLAIEHAQALITELEGMEKK